MLECVFVSHGALLLLKIFFCRFPTLYTSSSNHLDVSFDLFRSLYLCLIKSWLCYAGK